MAKRVIQECDLTKQEYDPDETVKITIKRKNKGAGRVYELSPAAASKLEQQLVAGPEAMLPNDWSFGYSKPDAKTEEPQTLADFDDDQLVASKKSELREAGILREEEETTERTAVNDSGCTHMNKGRIMTTLQDNKRFVYRKCKNCNARVPEMTAEQRQQYMNGKVDPDVRIKTQ